VTPSDFATKAPGGQCSEMINARVVGSVNFTVPTSTCSFLFLPDTLAPVSQVFYDLITDNPLAALSAAPSAALILVSNFATLELTALTFPSIPTSFLFMYTTSEY